MKTLRKKVLVLNRHWLPIGVCTVRRALTLMFKADLNEEPKAYAVDTQYQQHSWQSWAKLPVKQGDDCIRTVNNCFRIPSVIIVKTDKLPNLNVSFSRKSVFQRDAYSCQYCGIKPHYSELSLDHVVPRSRGGPTNFPNCVSCCKTCNCWKGDRTPEEANMKLLKKPIKPMFLGIDDHCLDFWQLFFVKSA